MTTNITEDHRRAFEALTGDESKSPCIRHTLSPSRVPLTQLTGIPL